MKKIIVTEAQFNKIVDGQSKGYECLNRATSSIGGMKKNSVGSKLTFVTPNEDNTLLNEGIDWEVGNEEKGGIIVFSTDVNAVEKSSSRLVNFIQQKFATIINRVKATEKIDKIANKHNLVGWTIGHYFSGRYVAKNGKNFGENSLTIDVVGVGDDVMISIAEDVCRVFEQECVLLKLNNGRILFINAE